MTTNGESILTARLTGESWVSKHTGGTRPTHDQISELAYHFYEIRGRQDGHAIDDWLRAEERLDPLAWGRGRLL